MKITNEFTVHTPIDRAWQVLTDLEGIAPCMPGAQLTGVEGDVYRGKVRVKVGPVISEFAGTARFAEKDEAGHRAVIDAKGRDARSAGNAAALVTAVLTPAGDSTAVSVDTDLKISGKLAQFGSGMIKEVSGKLLAQFVANLEAKLAAEAEAEPEVAVSSTVPQTADEGTVPPAPASPVPAQAVPATPAAEASAPVSAAGLVTEADADAAAVPDAAVPVAAAPDAGASVAAPDAAVPVAVAPVGVAPEVGAPVAAAPAAAAPVAGKAGAPVLADEPEPLDLLGIAGGSIYKRVVPIVVGVVVAGAVIAWVIARN